MGLVKQLYLVFLMLCCHLVYAQERELTLNGNVREKSGAAIRNATIEIYNAATKNIQLATASDQKGEFVAMLPAYNEYIITVEQLGFVTKKILVNTYMNNKPRKDPRFEFDIILAKRTRKKEGVELLNKPVVKIYYNENDKEYTYDPIYAKNIDKELRALTKKLDLIDNVKSVGLTEHVATQEDSLEFIKNMISKIQANTKQKVESLNRKNEFVAKKTEAVLAKVAIKEAKKAVINEVVAHDTSTGTRAIVGIKKALSEIEGQLRIRQTQINDKQQNIQTTQSEIMEEQFRMITNRNAQLYNEKLNKLKSQNVRLKYESSNPLTSMLDVIDGYEKAIKQLK